MKSSNMTQQENLATGFAIYAAEFRDGARILQGAKPFLFYPTFYCAIHSIELAIKGHLALCGIPKKKLASKYLGHDLAALVEEAENRNLTSALNLKPIELQSIKLVTSKYSGKCFEYPEIMHSAGSIGSWLDVADNLINGIQHLIPKPC